jgi:hypothetical protein
MKPAQIFNQYIWIINTLRAYRKLTLEQLNQKWQEDGVADGNPLQRSSFNRHRDAILDMFGIIIDCEPRTYKYYISNLEVLNDGSISQWLFSTLTVHGVLSDCAAIKDRIILENVPAGEEYLDTIKRAIKSNRRLLIGYSDSRAGKDAHNREKGIRRLEKAYKAGHLSKENINRRGYNKFLDMEGNTTVSINYDRIREDARWDGLKGYLTNTDIPTADVVSAYHNLWNVEKAFRIAKSKIEIRPMFHFTRRRIEAHICICFVALKVYKELERLLKLSDIKMSVDKVLNMAKTVTTISVYMPQNKKHLTKTMPMKRHRPIAKLFDENFWEAQ